MPVPRFLLTLARPSRVARSAKRATLCRLGILATCVLSMATGGCSSAQSSREAVAEPPPLPAAGSPQISMMALDIERSQSIPTEGRPLGRLSQEVQKATEFLGSSGTDALLFMNCQGQTWKMELKESLTKALEEDALTHQMGTWDSNRRGTSASSCRIQVAPGDYWLMERNGERVLLRRVQGVFDGSLVDSVKPILLSASGSARTKRLQPLTVTPDLIAFADDTSVTFYERPQHENSDAPPAALPDLVGTQFQWDSGLYGTPLAAGKTKSHHWVLTRREIVWMANSFDETGRSQWIQIHRKKIALDPKVDASLRALPLPQAHLHIDPLELEQVRLSSSGALGIRYWDGGLGDASE